MHGNFLLSIFIRGISALVALAANVVLARLLGVAEYGRYMALYSAAIVLGSFAVRGTDQLLTRELAAGASAEGGWRIALGLWTRRHVALGITAAIVVYFIWDYFTSLGSGWNQWLPDIAGFMLIAMYAGCTLVSGALNGFGASQRSQLLAPLVNNGVVLLAVAGLWLWADRYINGTTALWLQLVGYTIACAMGWIWLRSMSIQSGAQGVSSITQPAAAPRSAGWAATSRHFFFIAIAAVLVNRLDVVLVSMLAGNNTAGIYVAGARLAQVALLVATAVNIVLSPRIAQAWQQGNLVAVRRFVQSGLLFTVSVAIVEVIIASLYASDIVKLFGGAYASSAGVFVWVVVAYALWTVAAPYYALLSMTHHEKTVAALSWIVVVGNIAGMFLLVPRYGATGGAIAMVAGYVCVLPVLLFSARSDFRLQREAR